MTVRSGMEFAHAFGTASTATIAVVPAVAGQRVYVFRAKVTTGSPAVTLVFQDTSGAAVSQIHQLPANSTLWLDNDGEAWYQTAPGLGLQMVQSGTSPIGYDIYYGQGP